MQLVNNRAKGLGEVMCWEERCQTGLETCVGAELLPCDATCTATWQTGFVSWCGWGANA